MHEEAKGFAEIKQKNGKLSIDRVFSDKQLWIWTSDLIKGDAKGWAVFFLRDMGGFDYYFRDARSLR